MRTKVIGLFTAKLQDEDCFNIFELTHKYAYERNYGIITYYAGMDWYDKNSDDYVKAFYMVDYDLIDVLLIDAFRIYNTSFIKNLVDEAKSHNVPVIVYNDNVRFCPSVYTDIQKSFYQLVEDVIKEHKCKKIDLLLGSPNKWDSELLIKTYREVIEKYGIDFDINRIAYGQNISDTTRIAIASMLNKDMPDAILCASDAMAFELCHALKVKGIRIPEDVVVTSVGGSKRGQLMTPSLTTINLEPEKVVEKTFDLVDAYLSGNDVTMDNVISSSISYGQSCGGNPHSIKDCQEDIDIIYSRFDATLECDEKQYDMLRWLMQVTALEDISAAIHESLPGSSFLCVRDSFLQDIYAEMSVKNGVSKEAKLYILADNRPDSRVWTSFVLKETCPDLDKLLEQDIPIIIVPIRCKEMHYGYWILQSNERISQNVIIERFAHGLGELFGRYIEESRLRFTSHRLFTANENVKELEAHDVLTGMYNVNGFLPALEKLRDKCASSGSNMVVACVDIDGLSNINDAYGHFEGDYAIQQIAGILKESITDNDICSHFGSDEFVLAFECGEKPENMMNVYFAKLKSMIANYNHISEKEYSLEISYAYVSDSCTEKTEVRKLIDQAMNKKRTNKITAKGAAPSEANIDVDDDALHETIIEIIDNNRFKYAFQPIVNAKDGEIYAYEALMRSDTNTFISPITILDHAAMDERLYDIERATFFNIMAYVSENRELFENRKVFINSIPGFQLDSMDYARFKRLFQNIFSHLVVEITEQTEMDEEGFGLIKVRSDKEGFELAVDDFGSGYSNTTNLLKCLPHYVKIDRLLITDINEDHRKQHFVKNIIEFAHDNGFLALAEGVETKEELNAVIHMGADLIQGYYTAKPSYDVLATLPEDIKHDVIDANINVSSKVVEKKNYVVGREEEIVLMRLALEAYTGIVVSKGELNIIGNQDYTAGMSIKLRDDCSATIRLKNVHIDQPDDQPCIEIGRNSHLTIILEDDNVLENGGIHVPEGSSLRIIGEGNLTVKDVAMKSYCIGSGWDGKYGQITIEADGNVVVRADGSKSIGIGGGYAGANSFIHIIKGKNNINISGVECVGIGSAEGSDNILISDTNVEMILSVASGVGIGSYNGSANMVFERGLIMVEGSGNNLSGIGSLGEKSSNTTIKSAKAIVTLNGRRINLIGSNGGNQNFRIENARLDLLGEGNMTLGIGSRDMLANINAVQTTINLTLRSEEHIFIGAKDENVNFDHVRENFYDT